MAESPPLIDPFQRRISYLRMSVTDRCNFRCVYCMAEDMTFLPRSEVLSLEELARVARLFVGLGVQKVRLTGGEPLVRRGITDLVDRIAGLPGLKELAMTTNGATLAAQAADLRRAGLSRINISVDSLDPQRFRDITRTGDLDAVLAGIDAAQQAGLEPVKINAVILKGRNDDEVLPLVEFARRRRLDLSFIEEMPLGVIDEHDRAVSFVSSAELRALIERRYPLTPSAESSGGPSRYYRMSDSTIRVGFISPHSQNFCASCNRVRVTVEGRLLLCLGNEHSLDLKPLLRGGADDSAIKAAIRAAVDRKPERHHFRLDEAPQILRFMNATGG